MSRWRLDVEGAFHVEMLQMSKGLWMSRGLDLGDDVLVEDEEVEVVGDIQRLLQMELWMTSRGGFWMSRGLLDIEGGTGCREGLWMSRRPE